MFLVLCSNSIAQGNLQFNQVIIIDFTTASLSPSTLANTIPSTITVPAGKVWKIEQANLYVNFTSWHYTIASTGYSLYVNNTLLFNKNSASQFNPTTWLPAGTYNLRVSNETSSTYSYKGSINAIEFNVVP